MLPTHESRIDPADISLPPTEPIDITAFAHDWLEKHHGSA